ncbi:DUF6504 family protein [Aestuariimicrobium soli]|uniref:DUF6504 family protein n=1 Tax=Aestuariimicrobium soli TaxID=2035834 RepID=UPI003EBA94D2
MPVSARSGSGKEPKVRRRGDAIEVRLGRMDDPAQFLWRDQLWRVLAIESRWIESGEWWTSAQVRAARGDEDWQHGPLGGAAGTATLSREVTTPAPRPSTGGADDADLLRECEVWRVEAANGMAGSRGVYELAHTFHDGAWHLRAVID